MIPNSKHLYKRIVIQTLDIFSYNNDSYYQGYKMKEKIVTFRISESLYSELQGKVRNISRFLRSCVVAKIREEK